MDIQEILGRGIFFLGEERKEGRKMKLKKERLFFVKEWNCNYFLIKIFFYIVL